MLIRATNNQAHQLALAGIDFTWVAKDTYVIDGSTTATELQSAGLHIRYK